jgi:hypothetical protein
VTEAGSKLPFRSRRSGPSRICNSKLWSGHEVRSSPEIMVLAGALERQASSGRTCGRVVANASILFGPAFAYCFKSYPRRAGIAPIRQPSFAAGLRGLGGRTKEQRKRSLRTSLGQMLSPNQFTQQAPPKPRCVPRSRAPRTQVRRTHRLLRHRSQVRRPCPSPRRSHQYALNWGSRCETC